MPDDGNVLALCIYISTLIVKDTIENLENLSVINKALECSYL